MVVWGGGIPAREFLYVAGAAKGILRAAKRYNKGNPVNLGSAFEISIRELAHTIARLTSFEGSIVWDNSKPNGQPRRKLDTSRAELCFVFKSITSFEQELSQVIDWVRESRVEGNQLHHEE